MNLITSALVPFWPFFFVFHACDIATDTILDPLFGSSIAASIGTGPSSVVDSELSLPVGVVIYVNTLTLDVSIVGTTLDSAAMELDAGSLIGDLVASVVEGLNAATTSMLDALVGDIVDGDCNH